MGTVRYKSGQEIEIADMILQTIYEYCKPRPAIPNLMVQVFLRHWNNVDADQWYKNRLLIPKMQSIPESRASKIKINGLTARTFKTNCKILNLNPLDTATWLGIRYLRDNPAIIKGIKVAKLRDMKNFDGN